ncbi:hypothetical protein [Teichococcus aestuarii]
MAITRTGLEENQVAIYFAAVVAGAIAAVAAPGAAWGRSSTPPSRPCCT